MKTGVNKSIFYILAIAAFAGVLAGAAVVLQGRGGDDLSGLPVVDSTIFTHSEVADYQSAMPVAPRDMSGWRTLNTPPPETEKYTVVQKESFGPPVSAFTPPPVVAAVPKEESKPVVPREAVKEAETFIRHSGQPAKIIVIIDDMGMDKKHSREAINLPGPLTLAFLPYASGLDEMTADATKHGHQLLIHVPMEPMDRHLDMGPLGLKESQTTEQFDASLEKMFNSFHGYVGINNHMGSRLTKNETLMNRVMDALAKRNLLFVDSKTIGSSVASRVAAEHGLAHADRDVFLDNTDSIADIKKELHILESIANKRGYAVAIGHPRGATMQALRDWLPTLKGRGFDLAPVSAIVRKSAVKASSASLSATAGPPAPQPLSQPAPY